MTMGRKLYTGMDAFTEGLASSQNMFNSIANRRNQAGQLAINQQDQLRKQQLLPLMMQQYTDKHNLSPYEIQHLQAQINEANTLSQKNQSDLKFNNWMDNLAMGGQDSSAPSNTVQPSGAAPAENIPTGQQPVSSVPPVPMEAPTDRHSLVQRANEDQAKSDAAMGVSGSQVPGQEPSQPQQVPAQQNAQAPAPSIAAGGDTYNGEKVVTPARPGMEFLDKLAGMTLHGRTFKGPVVHPAQDGMQRVDYPSGKVTIQKVGPSYEEKIQEAGDIAANKQQKGEELKEQGMQKKLDSKVSTDIENETRSIVNSVHNLSELQEMLQKNKNLTSPAYAIPGVARLSKSEDVGKFINKSGSVQGEIAKNTTGARTGVGALNWAKIVKPDIGFTPERNLGTISANLDTFKQAFNANKKAWEEKNPGRKFPYELPKNMNTKMVKVRDNHTGKTLTMTQEEADNLMKGQ